MMKIVMATHEYSMSAALNKISRFANKNLKWSGCRKLVWEDIYSKLLMRIDAQIAKIK